MTTVRHESCDHGTKTLQHGSQLMICAECHRATITDIHTNGADAELTAAMWQSRHADALAMCNRAIDERDRLARELEAAKSDAGIWRSRAKHYRDVSNEACQAVQDERQRADAAEAEIKRLDKIADEARAVAVDSCFEPGKWRPLESLRKTIMDYDADRIRAGRPIRRAALTAPETPATKDGHWNDIGVYVDDVVWACPSCRSENMICDCDGVHIFADRPSSKSNRCVEATCLDCHWSGEFPASDNLDTHSKEKP